MGLASWRRREKAKVRRRKRRGGFLDRGKINLDMWEFCRTILVGGCLLLAGRDFLRVSWARMEASRESEVKMMVNIFRHVLALNAKRHMGSRGRKIVSRGKAWCMTYITQAREEGKEMVGKERGRVLVYIWFSDDMMYTWDEMKEGYETSESREDLLASG
jgi:hypothetical protein